MTLTLNKLEYEYLVAEKYFDSKLIRKAFNENAEDKSNYALDLSSEAIEETRLKFEDRLQNFGFDKDYNLTTEGKVVEGLIDKFFIH